MNDPFLDYCLSRSPSSLDDALVLFDESRRGLDTSSPHVVTWDWLIDKLCWNAARRVLLARLADFIGQLRNFNINVEFLLIGGSFVSRKEYPNDIDFLLFYSAKSGFDAKGLSHFISLGFDGLDYRATPTDAGILSLIKTSIFCHLLYEGKGGDKGSVIVPINSISNY